jgi:hypothetical protein
MSTHVWQPNLYLDAGEPFVKAVPSREEILQELRNEALSQAEKRHIDPRDELSAAIQLADAMGWEYIRIPTWIGHIAMDALHAHIQQHDTPD